MIVPRSLGGQMRFALLVGLMACSGKSDDDPNDAPSDSDTDADSDADADSDVDADSDADADSDTETTDTAPTDTGELGERVCTLWNTTRDSVTNGTWSGNVNSCDPGDVSADGRSGALTLLNLYREMVGHGPVITNAAMDSNAQDCALIQHANGFLSHTPSSTSACYTSTGASSAGSSNIATTPVTDAIDLYMADPGNTTTLGHRRWLLSNGLSTVGIGGTSSYSCHQVIGGGGGGTSKDWTAWPPPGPVPEGVWTVSWANLDSTGWSLQSDSIPLSGANVSVTRDDGTVLAMNVASLLSGYGSTHAISMIPDGWSVETGRSYTVDVTGLSVPIQYTVEVVDCSGF